MSVATTTTQHVIVPKSYLDTLIGFFDKVSSGAPLGKSRVELPLQPVQSLKVFGGTIETKPIVTKPIVTKTNIRSLTLAERLKESLPDYDPLVREFDPRVMKYGGLDNPGINICYFNSINQAMFRIPKLIEGLKIFDTSSINTLTNIDDLISTYEPIKYSNTNIKIKKDINQIKKDNEIIINNLKTLFENLKRKKATDICPTKDFMKPITELIIRKKDTKTVSGGEGIMADSAETFEYVYTKLFKILKLNSINNITMKENIECTEITKKYEINKPVSSLLLIHDKESTINDIVQKLINLKKSKEHVERDSCGVSKPTFDGYKPEDYYYKIKYYSYFIFNKIFNKLNESDKQKYIKTDLIKQYGVDKSTIQQGTHEILKDSALYLAFIALSSTSHINAAIDEINKNNKDLGEPFNQAFFIFTKNKLGKGIGMNNLIPEADGSFKKDPTGKDLMVYIDQNKADIFTFIINFYIAALNDIKKDGTVDIKNIIDLSNKDALLEEFNNQPEKIGGGDAFISSYINIDVKNSKYLFMKLDRLGIETSKIINIHGTNYRIQGVCCASERHYWYQHFDINGDYLFTANDTTITFNDPSLNDSDTNGTFFIYRREDIDPKTGDPKPSPSASGSSGRRSTTVGGAYKRHTTRSHRKLLHKTHKHRHY